MKVLVVLSAVILVVNALTDLDLWHKFKQDHGKKYENSVEETFRFSIFQDNLRTIERHNVKYAKGEETYYLGVTQFADQTHEEFKKMLGYSRASKPQLPDNYQVYKSTGVAAPDSIDWGQQGAVMEVKNQGCGDCWAFSSTGVLEGQNAILKGQRVSLSEQNLVDCSRSYNNGGCGGGNMRNSYDYVRDYGIESETDYPYLNGQDGDCYYDGSKSQLSVSSYVAIPQGDENSLKDAVGTVGPVAIAIDASYIGLYAGGVFDNTECSNINLNHGVLAVDYGNENGQDYWIVKNSWGADFGEAGYIRMKRNAGNVCGVATDATYPILK